MRGAPYKLRNFVCVIRDGFDEPFPKRFNGGETYEGNENG